MIEIKHRRKEAQLRLKIASQPDFILKVSSKLHHIKRILEIHPYWRSGFSWLGLLSSIIFGGNSIYIIYTNIDKLPAKIALLFAETSGQEILKDKYLLYLLPISVILIGILISGSLSKLFITFPKFVKFSEIIIFILSLTQLLSVYKIISIYT